MPTKPQAVTMLETLKADYVSRIRQIDEDIRRAHQQREAWMLALEGVDTMLFDVQKKRSTK